MRRTASVTLAAFGAAGLWVSPLGWSEAGYALALWLGAAGLWQAERRLLLLACLLGVLTLGARVAAVHGRQDVRMVRLGEGGEAVSSWFGSMLPEAGPTIAMGQLLTWAGHFDRDPEPDLAAILRAAYGRMRRQAGTVGTPAPATYLGQQAPAGHDTVIIEATEPTREAVIFLHGYAGNFTVYCWHFALAVRHRATVYCPSTGPAGRWWKPRGERIVRSTIAHARSQGAERVFLAGLSNGAIGVGRLARSMRGELSGLVLLSGSPSSTPPQGLPVLVVHGRSDPMTPVRLARRYAKRAGKRATYHELEGGHFIALSRHRRVRDLVRDWFDARRE